MANQYVNEPKRKIKLDEEEVSHSVQTVSGLSNIDYGKSTRYSVDEKIQAVVYWVLCRNLPAVCRYTGLEMHTLKHWKYNTDWWPKCENAVKTLRNEELDRKFSDLIDVALDELYERLEMGDEVLHQGQVYRKKVSAKELMTILGITYDKRALMRGDPTSRVENASSSEAKINKLAERFEQIAMDHQAWIDAPKAQRTDSVDDITEGEVVESSGEKE